MMKNMKKMKGVSVESSVYGVGDGGEAKMRFKHQSLLQDFAELEKETEAMKQRLQKAKRKKLTLLAEVRFLRRRYKYLVNNPPKETSSEALIPLQNPVVQREITAKERNYGKKDSIRGRPYEDLDLNQASLPGEEEPGVPLQLGWEPLRVDKKLKRCSTTEVAMAGIPKASNLKASNLKFSIHRDFEKGTRRPEKRRVSWQDRVGFEGLNL